MSLRDDLTKELGVFIGPQDHLEHKFLDLDQAGRLNQKQLWRIILHLVEHVEQLEQKK